MVTDPALVNELMDLTSSHGTTLDVDERPVDMFEVVRALVPSIETTMASLYDLQAALIKIDGRRYTKRFTDIRASLKAQWEVIVKLLQQTHAFATDVAYLRRHMRRSTLAEVQEFLDDMSAEAVKLKAASALLSQEHFKTISSCSEQLDILKRYLRSDIISRTQDFLESSRPYEDPNPKRAGKRALKELIGALEGIQAALALQSRFWSDQVVTCQACRQALIQGLDTQEKAWVVQLTSDWKRYEDAVEKSIHSIIKVSDALNISPGRVGKHHAIRTLDRSGEWDGEALFLLAAIVFMASGVMIFGVFQGLL